MATTEKIRKDIEKTKEKLSELQKKLRSLEAQLVEEENLEIVRMVKAVRMDSKELTLFLKAYASGLISLPEDMMEAISTAVSRKTNMGTILCPEQAITVEDGLKAYTIDAAKALRRDGISGSIEAGKLADFAVLSMSPLDIPTEEIEKMRDITVDETWVDGEKIYERS